MNNLREVPIIPASYAVTRNVYNAFRAVVNNQKNPRYQLSSYNRDINSEIVRKRSYVEELNEMGDIVLVENSEETAHEELIVLDRSGRLQLPKDFMDALEIKGGDKVKVELDENGEKLVLFRSGGT